jgi:cob(I)alamin adenosyltransferase
MTTALVTLTPALTYLLIGHWLARQVARWAERGCVRLWEECDR